VVSRILWSHWIESKSHRQLVQAADFKDYTWFHSMIALHVLVWTVIALFYSNRLIDGSMFGEQKSVQEKSDGQSNLAIDVIDDTFLVNSEVRRIKRSDTGTTTKNPTSTQPSTAKSTTENPTTTHPSTEEPTTTRPPTTTHSTTPHPTTPKPDCEWAEWNSWSKCDCRLGTQTRGRNLKELANEQCELRGCGQDLRPCTRTKCPIDCVYSKWSSWADCSGGCGEGSRRRTRSIRVPALYGGRRCRKFVEKEYCESPDVFCQRSHGWDCGVHPLRKRDVADCRAETDDKTFHLGRYVQFIYSMLFWMKMLFDFIIIFCSLLYLSNRDVSPLFAIDGVIRLFVLLYLFVEL